ncbi:MAG: hypothetical protein V4568_18405, partial [Pseudomonadota bacterium]
DKVKKAHCQTIKTTESSNTAFSRYAGTVDPTDDYNTSTWLNPWDQKPTFLNQAIDYAGTLSQ